MENLKTKGIELPRLGFGTFRMQGDGCQPVVESAIELGYRHIDTAEMYQNEEAVGAAIAASGIERKQLHLTTKVWHENLAPTSIRRALDSSLSKLRVDYVDMYMVHWPSRHMEMGLVMETMQEFLQNGTVRSIGVCNFNYSMLRKAVEELGAPIAAHQIEYHAFLDQSKMLSYLRERQIPLVAYAPLAQGRAASDPELQRIGVKHGVSAAQVALAWLLGQDGVAVIPKAQRRESQKSNLNALTVKLDDDDRHAIAILPKNHRFVTPPFAPEWDA